VDAVAAEAVKKTNWTWSWSLADADAADPGVHTRRNSDRQKPRRLALCLLPAGYVERLAPENTILDLRCLCNYNVLTLVAKEDTDEGACNKDW